MADLGVHWQLGKTQMDALQKNIAVMRGEALAAQLLASAALQFAAAMVPNRREFAAGLSAFVDETLNRSRPKVTRTTISTPKCVKRRGTSRCNTSTQLREAAALSIRLDRANFGNCSPVAEVKGQIGVSKGTPWAGYTPLHSTDAGFGFLNMIELDARDLIELIHALLGSEHAIRGTSGVLTPMLAAERDQANGKVISLLKKLELPHSTTVAEEMVAGAKTIERLHEALEQLWNSIALELKDRKFYAPVSKYAGYFEQPKLFGDEVFDKFPSARNDISEAGTCLALERGTACVMHLMRACEVGLKVLAAAHSVPPQSNWGAYLQRIDDALNARIRASGARSLDEQFYAESRVTLDGVRRAWRNPTMHIENNYSPERAEEILISARALMRHLAARLSE
jgi:hypothetical protein